MATELDFTFDIKPNDRWVTIRFLGNNDYDSKANAWIGPPLSARGIEEIAARLRQEQSRCVHVSCEPQSPGPDFAKALIPSLEMFIFDTVWETLEQQSPHTVGDMADILNACPNLRRAFFTGRSRLSPARHEHLLELVITGHVLDSSVLPALGASQFPALRKLFLEQQCDPLEPTSLVRSLRSLDAPSLADMYIVDLPIFAFLTAWGSAELPWNLCLVDYDFDDIEGLLEVLDGNDALRSGKLRLDLGFMPFPHEVEELLKRGVTMMVDTIKLQAHWS